MDILEEFKKYLEENYKVDEERNTIKSYLSDIKQFINFFEEYYSEQIVDFTRGNLIEYKSNFLERNNYKFSTINRKMASLSIYENFLIEKDYRESGKKIIKKSDFYKIVRPYITASMLPEKTIKKVRFKAESENSRDNLIFVLLDEGALRVSEMTHIQLERDVNFSMYQIVIIGKGNKVRTITMTTAILEAIKEYLPERKRILNGRENKYLIVSNKTANTNKPMSRTSINNILEKYCSEVKENKINPHIFRHYRATEWYQEGHTDLMLKKKLGQSSNATDIYIHPGREKI